MKLVCVLICLIVFNQVLNACPNCVGTITDTCPPFFSASCYTSLIHDEDCESKKSTQEDILILKGEHDHEEKK